MLTVNSNIYRLIFSLVILRLNISSHLEGDTVALIYWGTKVWNIDINEVVFKK